MAPFTPSLSNAAPRLEPCGHGQTSRPADFGRLPRRAGYYNRLSGRRPGLCSSSQDSPMTSKKAPPPRGKKIALIAHDHKKRDLVEWARFNRGTLSKHALFATGTTGRILEEELGIPVQRLQSGPIGGDQQIGAMIVEGSIDFLIFFWDPLEAQPHDPDVKALLRLAVVWNIPAACNRATADYMISSPLMNSDYERLVPNYGEYLSRPIPAAPESEPAKAESPKSIPKPV
ncbi:MAG: methylglyoxal synthase [Opitutaceae bacterium]|nr:methylglyoxal synthase [Opitutaceae bacterium]